MDRGRNNLAMEAVAETEEELESLDEQSDDDDDEDLDGMRSKEPNQFDGLCDGVVNATALLHESMAEFIGLKNELLQHTLPPNVLLNLTLSSSKIYRSITDLNQPLNELLRLVRVYSTPWEEKSEALKKLHEDYESKMRQLNIAIKRLQLVEIHSRRIAKDKRIMNWEKLFMKVTTEKGHGRRWKFRIQSVKEKARQGLEVITAYIRQLDQSGDEDDDEEELDAPSDSDKQDISDNEASESEGEELSIPVAEEREETPISEKKVTFVEQVIEKPIMFNAECWTKEPTYERILNIRVFKPQEITEDYRHIVCMVSHGMDFVKTKRLDPPAPSTPIEDKKEEPKKVAPKRKGLIGSRVDKKKEEEELKRKEEEEKQKKTQEPIVYEDIQFPFADAISPGVKRPKTLLPDQLKIAIHNGPTEDMVALATVDVEELEKLDLPSVIVQPPAPDAGTEEEEDDTPVPEYLRVKEPEEQRQEILISGKPMLYPMYPIQASRLDALNKPCGRLPLLLYWTKKTRPQIADKKIGTASIYEIVEDMTGFDMKNLTKEDLHKDTISEGCSVIAFTPDIQEVEETVSKEEIDELINQHQAELSQQQDEYEARINEMMENINQLQDALTTARLYSPHLRDSPHIPSRVSSAGPRIVSPIPTKKRTRPKPPAEKPPAKNFRIGRPLPKWGEALPEDFFERMELLQREADAHRRQINEQVIHEMRERIERNLAGEYKLGSKGENEMYDTLKDVSLPALFMPFKNTTNVYNPRAHQYFHATGSTDLRLTQPPSMIQLPPLSKHKLSVVNLFDLSQNFSRRGPEWLMQQYMAQEDNNTRKTPMTPAPTMNAEGTLTSLKAEQFARGDTFLTERNQSAGQSATNGHVPHAKGDTLERGLLLQGTNSEPQSQEA